MLTLTQLPKWNNLNYKRCIEDDQIVTEYEITSIQQFFLCSTEHRMFDDYYIAINPDVRNHS